MKNFFKNKDLYKYIGIYYIFSVLTLIITSGVGGMYTWDSILTYQFPLFVPLYSFLSFGIMLTHWIGFLIITFVIGGILGAFYFIKINTVKKTTLSYICFIFFAVGITLLAMVAATI